MSPTEINRQEYSLLGTLGLEDRGVYRICSPRWGNQLWTNSRSRKEHICIITGCKILKGVICLRPMTNAGNRYHRISSEGLQYLKQEKI